MKKKITPGKHTDFIVSFYPRETEEVRSLSQDLYDTIGEATNKKWYYSEYGLKSGERIIGFMDLTKDQWAKLKSDAREVFAGRRVRFSKKTF